MKREVTKAEVEMYERLRCLDRRQQGLVRLADVVAALRAKSLSIPADSDALRLMRATFSQAATFLESGEWETTELPDEGERDA